MVLNLVGWNSAGLLLGCISAIAAACYKARYGTAGGARLILADRELGLTEAHSKSIRKEEREKEVSI
jgi:hypothetical protein